MTEKTDQMLTVHFTENELKRIARCAQVERKTPDEWSRRTLDYVARRIAKAVHGESEVEV